MNTTTSHGPAGADLEELIANVGQKLSAGLSAVLAAVPGAPRGPQALSQTLGLREKDKVLTSRLLKALRARDPLGVVHLVPGPDPLRRVLRAAQRVGVADELLGPATAAVDRFEQLIRREIGDRSSLDALICAWLPEARVRFELRRKQEAFRAMSQLRGVAAETCLATVLLQPSDDGVNLDAVRISGLLGLRRLRPGSVVRCAGRPADGRAEPSGFLELPEFCHAPPAPLEVQRTGDALQALLADPAAAEGSVHAARAEWDRAYRELELAAGRSRRAVRGAARFCTPETARRWAPSRRRMATSIDSNRTVRMVRPRRA